MRNAFTGRTICQRGRKKGRDGEYHENVTAGNMSSHEIKKMKNEKKIVRKGKQEQGQQKNERKL